MNLENLVAQLNWREAIKNFDAQKKVSDGDFNQILEAMRLTASSYGLQPWKFVVVKNEEIRNQLQAASYGQPQVAKASHFLVLCAKSTLSTADVDHYMESMAEIRGIKVEALDAFKANLVNLISSKTQDQLSVWSAKQVYIALGNLLTVCAEAGIDTCPMEGFDAVKYNEILGLDKQGVTAVVACAVGYRVADDIENDRKKVRFEKSEVIMEI